jgi:hypothetical protein
MFGGTAPAVAIVFVALAVVFAAVSLRNFLIEEGKLTPARKTWLRVSFIFSGVAIGLFVWHTFLA